MTDVHIGGPIIVKNLGTHFELPSIFLISIILHTQKSPLIKNTSLVMIHVGLKTNPNYSGSNSDLTH